MSAPDFDQGCSCGDPHCGYDAHDGNPLRGVANSRQVVVLTAGGGRLSVLRRDDGGFYASLQVGTAHVLCVGFQPGDVRASVRAGACLWIGEMAIAMPVVQLRRAAEFFGLPAGWDCP